MPDNSFQKIPFTQKVAYSRNNPESSIFPSPIQIKRAPTTSDTNYVLGQVWIDISVSPAVSYEYMGGGVWETGGNTAATTSSFGIVELSDDITTDYPSTKVPTVTATKDYVDTISIIETITIPSADVLTMATSPVELIPAPGSGKYIEFISAQLILDYNSIAYTESGDNMAIRYTDGSGVIVSQDIESTGFIDQTADTITNALPKIDAIVAATGAVNQALVLDNTGSDFADGNSDLIVKIAYRVVETGL